MRDIRAKNRRKNISDIRIVEGNVDVAGKVEIAKSELPQKISKVNDLLRLIGITFLDLGKLLFAGVLIDNFFNSSVITDDLGIGFWAITVIVLLLLGFTLVALTVNERR